LHNLSQKLHQDIEKNNSNRQLYESIPIWEQEVTRLLQHPYLERLIGVNLTKFNHYLKCIGEVFPILNVNGDYRVNAPSHEISRSDKVHLFLTLYWLRQYPTVVNFETIFSIPSWAFSRLINRTLVALDSTLEDTATWPDDDEFEEIIWKFRDVFPTQFRQLAVIVDGTEIRIPRPRETNAEKATYSVKKKQHSITLLLMCTPHGKLIHCSEVLIGANDQSHWNNLNYRAWFENKNYGIAGDGGFTFNHKDAKFATKEIPIHGYTPFKRPPNGTLTEIEKKYNRILASIRVVVENVIGQLKKWRIINGVYRHFSVTTQNQIDFNLVVRVLVKLTAEKLQQRPLRSPTFKLPIADLLNPEDFVDEDISF